MATGIISDNLTNRVEKLEYIIAKFANINSQYFTGTVKIYVINRICNVVGMITANSNVPNGEISIATSEFLYQPGANVVHDIALLYNAENAVRRISYQAGIISFLYAGAIPSGTQIFFNATYLINH